MPATGGPLPEPVGFDGVVQIRVGRLFQLECEMRDLARPGVMGAVANEPCVRSRLNRLRQLVLQRRHSLPFHPQYPQQQSLAPPGHL